MHEETYPSFFIPRDKEPNLSSSEEKSLEFDWLERKRTRKQKYIYEKQSKCSVKYIPYYYKRFSFFSSISDCFGDQKAIKTPKLNTILLELIARALNMLIGLKGNNYYSKVFKRVNYKLSNSTF